MGLRGVVGCVCGGEMGLPIGFGEAWFVVGGPWSK